MHSVTHGNAIPSVICFLSCYIYQIDNTSVKCVLSYYLSIQMRSIVLSINSNAFYHVIYQFQGLYACGYISRTCARASEHARATVLPQKAHACPKRQTESKINSFPRISFIGGQKCLLQTQREHPCRCPCQRSG